ncbi:MAG: ACT domain-containing protein [Victivallales bacterium]|nr:ACT domain-containing protein [Victivallales bacterium]
MIIRQLSIFLENRSGRINEIASLLAAENINIRALSLADSSDFGVMRLIVDDSDKALACLRKNNISTGMTSVVAVEVPDRPGGLAEVMRKISQAGLDVKYMYSLPEKKHENAIMIMRFDDAEGTAEKLAREGLSILKQQEVLNR